MKNKILIFGKGFIGMRLQEALGCDISDRNIASLIAKLEPEMMKCEV